MLRSITASSFLFIAFLSFSCSEPENAKDEQSIDNDTPPPFETLLLPEDRDTTTVFNLLPDSVFQSLNYDSTVQFLGKTYRQISFWHLADVTFKLDTSAEGFLFMKPTFSNEVLRLDGKRIIISGFLIPVSHTDKLYALSANPYSSCFFCGNAGPESVMDIRFTSTPKFEDDAYISVRGTLRLNATNYYDLNYILEDAQLYVDARK